MTVDGTIFIGIFYIIFVTLTLGWVFIDALSLKETLVNLIVLIVGHLSVWGLFFLYLLAVYTLQRLYS